MDEFIEIETKFFQEELDCRKGIVLGESRSDNGWNIIRAEQRQQYARYPAL